LTVEPGFKKAKPKEPAFRAEFQAEVERLRTFLQTRGTATTHRRDRVYDR
jgi:GrpB-like predicted nucleotidyltransferase (UPF0157 family)